MRSLIAVVAFCSLSACNCPGPIIGTDDAGPDDGDGGLLEDGGLADGGLLADGGIATCVPGATAITVGPANQTVNLSGTTAAPVSFTATASLADGGSADVTNQVAWSVRRGDDTPPGSIAQGVYSPGAGAGGSVTVTAADACLGGSTGLTLVLSAVFNDPGPAVVARFAGTVVTSNAAKSPLIVYPNDGTRFPRNIYKVLFQWRKSGNDHFRLTFDGPFSRTVVYSDGVNPLCAAAVPAAGCFEADRAVWQAVAGSNAGAATTLTIDGVLTGDANVYRGQSIELGFSKRDVRGAIFYWSTTSAGIRRASVSDSAPEAYLVAKPVPTVLAPNNATVKCVACHTVSRNGKKLFAGTQTSAANGEFVYDVTLMPPPIPAITTQISTANKGFGTFSPDDTRVVATIGNILAEFDSTSGARVATLSPLAATNPDWSPSGSELVFSNKGGDSPGTAGLDVIAYSGADTWGAVRALVPAAGLTNIFPSYSPDGTHIAYARGKGGHGDKTLQLFLVKADGSAPPVELVTANRHVNNTVTTGQFENNMPTWAPPGDLDWVAFNSLRPYGVVYPTGGTQQIWVAAIDRSKLDGGVDPSYPAFRFAFQDLAENNHRAFWTLDVRVPDDGGTPVVPDAGPPPDAGACLTDGEACDQVSGPSCCGTSVCDVGADGGTLCGPIIN
ncbi:MAG: TolB family protein [Myxococcaceae bacterium]